MAVSTVLSHSVASLVDKESGESMSITDARNQKGPGRIISQIREDIKEIKERVSGLTP